MIARARQSLHALLIALDTLACAIWLGVFYLLDLSDKPTGRQTISGYVGKAALHGHKWARLPERLIDAVMSEGHCLRAYQQGQG